MKVSKNMTDVDKLFTLGILIGKTIRHLLIVVSRRIK